MIPRGLVRLPRLPPYFGCRQSLEPRCTACPCSQVGVFESQKSLPARSHLGVLWLRTLD
jgi:hypothetical protein